MMIITENTSREDLEMAILEENDLYARFDEQRLLSGEYTDEELRNEITQWILDGDELA